MRYNPKTNPRNTIFFVGQEFVDALEFKRAILGTLLSLKTCTAGLAQGVKIRVDLGKFALLRRDQIVAS